MRPPVRRGHVRSASAGGNFSLTQALRGQQVQRNNSAVNAKDTKGMYLKMNQITFHIQLKILGTGICVIFWGHFFENRAKMKIFFETFPVPGSPLLF